GPKFCAMKISHEVKEQFSEQEKGMAEKSREFLEGGAEIYKDTAAE
ncbi:MAG: hypothetical protein HQ504_11845, partial [Rhodospirillaceae bacterium]|nr:hypothetical protein [Rhodospirillaceae bacterium]